VDVGRGVHAGVERRPDEKMSSCRLMCIRKQFVSDEEGFLTSFLIPDEIRSELAVGHPYTVHIIHFCTASTIRPIRVGGPMLYIQLLPIPDFCTAYQFYKSSSPMGFGSFQIRPPFVLFSLFTSLLAIPASLISATPCLPMIIS